MFHFYYKIWNAPSEKVTFLWNLIFFQCCFMSETQVLMTVSNFRGFFSRNHFLRGGFTFQWGNFIFKWGAPHRGGNGNDKTPIQKLSESITKQFL